MKTNLGLYTQLVPRKRRGSALLGALACLSLLATAAVSNSRVAAAGTALTLHGANTAAAACDPARFNQAEQRFLTLDGARQKDPSLVPLTNLRSSAAVYITEAEKCYAAHEGLASSMQSDDPPPPIDDGGVWFSSGLAPNYVLRSTKWGPSQRGTPGGTVTYSYTPNGLSFADEGYGTGVAVQSLSTYSACFLTDIANAFSAWSAVANIQFVQVADNNAAFDAVGAQGDIRIGAHPWPQGSNVLAHAYFPPPNGTSAAGDVHFNSNTSWSCNTTWIDIGIVAMHELGHSIGLDHQPNSILAVMNPAYNPALTVLQPDDISGASTIYGPAPAPTFTISGNAGASGAVIWYFDGTPKTSVANESGDYSIAVPSGWSGTLTPLKPGYHFTPWSHSYGSSLSDLIDQDFAADPFAAHRLRRRRQDRPDQVRPEHRRSSWFNSTNGQQATANLGTDTTSYVPRSDFDGDGKADPAKFLSTSAPLWYHQIQHRHLGAASTWARTATPRPPARTSMATTRPTRPSTCRTARSGTTSPPRDVAGRVHRRGCRAVPSRFRLRRGWQDRHGQVHFQRRHLVSRVQHRHVAGRLHWLRWNADSRFRL